MLYESALSGRPDLNLEQIVVHMPQEPGDAAAMQAAWQVVAARHPALRMIVDWQAENHPVQITRAEARFGFATKDWSRDPDPARRLAAWLADDRATGADASTGPVWRLTLIAMAPQASALVWTFPHSLLDGRSFAPVLEEVFALYDAARAGGLPPVPLARPDPDAHYRAAAGVSPGSVAHFVEQLGMFETPNEVGLGLPCPATPGRKPVLELELSPRETRRLGEHAARVGGTLSTALNAAWGIVLARTSGQGQAVFGVTLSGRHLLAQSPSMLGCLINTVPLSVVLDENTTLDLLLRAVRTDQLSMRPHEHCPLTSIRAALALPPEQPLFRSLVVYDRDTLNARMHRLGGAWAGRRVDLHEEGALPLTLAAYGEERLRLRLEHDPAVVSGEAAARYLDYLGRLLQAMAAAEGDLALADLEMRPPQEVRALEGWSQGPAFRTPPPDCLAAAFLDMAQRQGEATAVIAPDGTGVSFAALAARSADFAGALAARGIGPGATVALCLPRSVDHLAAMLAVLRCGAAFLPMDPAYPAESLSFMLADSGAALIVARTAAPWMGAICPVLETGAMRAGVESAETESADAGDTPCPPLPAPDAERGAYVIYTSGTTGRPKGVAVPVRALAAHAVAARDWMALSPQDRVLQFTSLGFDVSLEEIVPTLLVGARLVLRSDLAAKDPRALLDLLAERQVTVANLPTGYWQALIDDMELTGARLPPSVRLVIAGGERVPPAALRRWRAIEPSVDWANGYGPTEATITASGFYLPGGAALPDGEVPVGRALAHAELRVLAADGSVAPLGCPGELWIGGPCVASGYVARPDVMAQRFVTRGGKRLYRSGDLAWWAPDGQLMLGGRADRQIKLRGYRIEPAEVERVLEGLEDVGQALVAALDQGTPAARLVAWVRPSVTGQPLNPGALEAAAAVLLPPQMRPVIVPVTDWPMRAGGKIDIARLPRPKPRVLVQTEDPADDAMTRQIATLFADLLSVPNVGPDSGFFELGGHSLLLIRLIGRIEAIYGRRLSVATVHASPTPRAIAALLCEGGGGRRSLDDCIIAIQPQGSLPPIYGVHVLGVNGSYYRPLARAMGKEQPIFGLTVGLLDEFTPTGVAETAELYHRVIDRIQPRGALSLVAVSLGSYVALELAQRLLAAGREVTMLAILDAEGPGGRPRIDRRARIGVHLGRLRAAPLRYLSGQAAHKLNEFHHWFEKLKLVLSGRLGRPTAPATSVEGFVAANELAVQAYRPRPYTGRLTVVRAGDSVFDSPEAIATGLGWARVAAGGLDLVEVPGDHLTIMDEPAVGELARAFQLAMARATPAQGS